MGLDLTTPHADSSGPLDSEAPASPSLESWLGDVLLAYDAARAAGLESADIALTPRRSSANESEQAAGQLALAQACLDRLHRRWPWHVEPLDESSPEAPLATLNLKLGRFTLLRLIGSGGHGLVFLAHDPTLARNVALKIPRPEWLASHRHPGRFLRKARALARLDHPGIVPIYDFGESGSVCYLATAHIDGPNLAEWLARQPESPSPKTAAKLLLSLTEAIAHAHSRGVLHLDLKPSNVLLDWCDDPDGHLPRITDFGLAKLLDDTRDETRTETPAFGTPRYMSPEQAAGDRSRFGPTTDVYGLGAILSEILGGPTLNPTIDSARSGVVSRPEIPEPLRQILARCLKRSPQDRYPTALALAEDLGRFVAGQPVIAPRLGRSTLRRAWEDLKVANRLAIVSLLLLAGSLSICGVILWAHLPFVQANPGAPPARSKASATRAALVSADPRDERYVREMRNAFHLIHDNHDAATADSERLDLWAGPYAPGQSDPRGFEWGYLKNLAHRESLTLQLGKLPNGNPSAIFHVRFSPDGARLVTAGRDGTARVWDAVSGRCLLILDHVGIEVNSAAFSPDGNSLATGSDDGCVRLWDAASGSVTRRFDPPHADEVHAALFTPDGKRLVSASKDGRLAVWSVSTGEQLLLRDAAVENIEVLAIAGDGSFAAAGGTRDGRIAILSLSDFSLRWHERSGSGIIGLNIAPDNRLIAVSSHNDVALVDLTSRSPEVRLSGHHGGVESVAFAPDQSVLASVSGANDHSVMVWDRATHRLRDVLHGHSRHNYFVTFSPDGKRLATASADGTSKIWDLTRRTDRTTIHVSAGTILLDSAIALESNSIDDIDRGRLRLISIASNGRVIWLDGEDGRTLETRDPFPRPIVGAKIDPLTRLIAGVSADGVLMIADAAEKRAPVTVARETFDSLGSRIAFDRTGRILVAQAQHGRGPGTEKTAAGPVRDSARLVVETATGRVISRLPSFSGDFPANFYTFFTGGRRLAAGHRAGGDGIVIWDLENGRARTTPPPGKSRRITAFTVSPDGKFVASGDNGQRIVLHDAESLSLKSELLGHRNEISSLAFSPDNRRLASGDISGAVKLWDVVSGEELLELEGLLGPAHFLEFTPDGLSLVAASHSDGGRFVIWHGRPHRSEPTQPTD